MGLSRRIFTKEFKLAAVRRLEQGVSIGEAARALETCSTACCITATCSSVVRAVGALRPSRIRRKRNPDLLSPPFPFPPPGANRGGRVPPTPRHAAHRPTPLSRFVRRLPPQEGCRPLVHPPLGSDR